jgi:hypothetical protein
LADLPWDGLLDRVQLIVYPKVLSSGRQLSRSGTDAALELFESKAFSSGPVLLAYAVAQDGQS